jgi:hypothetical protein
VSSSGATRPASAADRFMRKLLLIENAAPKSLISVRTSLAVAAIRCVVTYAVIPALLPIFGWLGVVATPVAMVLTLVAIGFAIFGLRRVWLADFRYRWAYTTFIVVLVTALTILLVGDVRTLLA